jgi:hypothetical protein
MGGADRVYSNITNYLVTKKRRKNMLPKIFFHLFVHTIWNSNVLYSKNDGLKNHL